MKAIEQKLLETQDDLIDALRDLQSARLALECLGAKLMDGRWVKPRIVCHNCEDNPIMPVVGLVKAGGGGT